MAQYIQHRAGQGNPIDAADPQYQQQQPPVGQPVAQPAGLAPVNVPV